MLKTIAAVAAGAAVLTATPGVALRAVVQGIGDRPPLDGVRWQIDFRSVDGAIYIERESALDDMDHRGAHLTGVSGTFEDMQLVDAIPADRRLGLAYTTGIADP